MKVNNSNETTSADKHKRILALCDSIRTSHPDMEYLYTQGQCYNFALILRSQYEGEIWYDHVQGHVYYKVDDVWYDVRGRHYKMSEFASVLDHRDGHKPHRWGLGDNRRLHPKMERPISEPVMSAANLEKLLAKQRDNPNNRGIEALLGEKHETKNEEGTTKTKSQTQSPEKDQAQST